jgi:hypothetical protein
MKKPKGKTEAERKEMQTTVRIDNIMVVKMHMLERNEKTFNGYINHLIKDDIMHKGSDYIIKKYFKEKQEVINEKNKAIQDS